MEHNSRHHFTTTVLGKLGIEPNETRLVAWAGGSLAILGWANVSVRNAAETFFLKRVGVDYLPLAFLASSILLVLTTWVVGRLLVHRDRPRLLPWVFAFLALTLIPMWLLVRWEVPGVFVLLIFASKQIEAIALLVFWVAMGDLLHGRQAKRLFAPFTAGLTLGTFIGSFVSEPVSRVLGIDGLIYFSAAVLGVGALATIPLRRQSRLPLAHGLGDPARQRRTRPLGWAGDSLEQKVSLAHMWQTSALFRLLLLTTLCGGLLGPMLYFQFSYVADLATAGAGGEQKLLALYAQFRGWINLAVLVAQLSIASRMYRRIGVPLSATLSPLIYLLGFVGLSVQLSLSAGIAAVAGTRLQDHAVGDPGLRVLFNLFPERVRAPVTALLDPIKRSGGVLGNLVVLGALALGTALWVGYAAIPIAMFWLVVAVMLWRAYPALLVQATSDRIPLDDAQIETMLDPATVRALAGELVDPDLNKCRAALELLSDASPDLAVDAFSRAALVAPDANRPLILSTLDHLLDRRAPAGATNGQAAACISSLLTETQTLTDRERLLAIRAYGQLTEGADAPATDLAVFQHALGDPAAAVRLAASAALHRHGRLPSEDVSLDQALAATIRTDDALTRHAARQEYRALLLSPITDADWLDRLHRLADFLGHESDRRDAAEALVEVARRHGMLAAAVSKAMLILADDPDPKVRAAVLRFIGYAGLLEYAPHLVAHIGSSRADEAAGARDGLVALGPKAASALMVEHSFGRRSTRDAILSIVRDLQVDKGSLQELYAREVTSIQQTLVNLHALTGGTTAPIVLQRLQERIDEELHTALLFLTAIHNDDRIAELDTLLRRTGSEREHAILLEALEVFLSPQEKVQLLPPLEHRGNTIGGRSAVAPLGMELPSREDAIRTLLHDADELTRTLVWATHPEGLDLPSQVADHTVMLQPVEIAIQIKTIPIFERLSTRQLIDLAKVVHEETHPPGAIIFGEGEEGSCMYLITEGDVQVLKGETLLAEFGPQNFFGEMALFEGVNRSATVRTNTGVRLLRLERNDLLTLIEELPAIAIGICQSLSHRLRDLSNRAQV